MYYTEFNQAIERTQKLSLELPVVDFSDEKYLSKEVHEQIPHILYETFGELDLNEVSQQCMSLHLRIQEPLSQFFGINFMYTLGYVHHPPHDIFKTEESQLISMLEKGLESFALNMHAWLTLPSMEILDFSLSTTLALHYGWKEGHGRVITGMSDELKHGLRYHPMLIGNDFLRKIGAQRDFSMFFL